MKKAYISIVVPVYNEQANIKQLYQEVKARLHGIDYEFIFVNDASTDNSQQQILNISKKDKNVKLINLSRNFGQQIAITCGIDFAAGDAAIIMDCDLQDPPALIPKMIDIWKTGYDVVYGVRKSRDDTPIKKYSALIFYKILSRLSGTQIPPDVGDFRLISKKTIMTLRQTREYQRFLRGIIAWVGFSQKGVEYARPKRFAGRSNYTFVKMIKLALDAVLSFSFFPLRIASFLGLMTALGAILFIFYALYVQSIGDTVRGWSSTILVILFLGSVQLFTIGIIGEYLGRIYEEVKRRPLYIVDSKIGFKS